MTDIRPQFITFEGGEGTGKSTQVAVLASRLRDAGLDVLTTREPGGAPGAEEIRELLVTGEPGRWTPLTETLLLAAARDDHLNRTVRPALASGQWVISDRFSDSTRAYQGAAHGLGGEAIEALDKIVVGATQPNLTLIFDMPVDVGLARATSGDGGNENRFERMGRDFHERLRAAFLEIAEAHKARCAVIDASKSIDAVSADVWRAVAAKFPELG